MSVHPRPEPIDAQVVFDAELSDDEETVDGVAVLDAGGDLTAGENGVAAGAAASPGAGLSTVASPAVQAAAAAATGFVAGAATLALVRRRGARKLARTTAGSRRVADALPIVGTRSFLIDVHLIGEGSPRNRMRG